MISEKEFVGGFSGFWQECLPFLTNQVVAELNLQCQPWPKRGSDTLPPLDDPPERSKYDVIAELAFSLFDGAFRSGRPVLEIARNDEVMKRICDDAMSRVIVLRRDAADTPALSSRDTKEAVELARRLEDYFRPERLKRDLRIQPRFKGYGVLGSCYGDVLADKCLCEIKMVARNLRSIDLRQVLVYCALNHASQGYEIDHVSILNPRRGTDLTLDLEELARRVSGRTSAVLCERILSFVSGLGDTHHDTSLYV